MELLFISSIFRNEIFKRDPSNSLLLGWENL